jgi:protein-tyrosine phosphatase
LSDTHSHSLPSYFGRDDANFLSCIPASNIFIEAGAEAGGVLVHCFGGRSRSAALIAAFLMSTTLLDLDAVMGIIKRVRPVVSINR